MALATVNLVLDLCDGRGTPVGNGTVVLAPNATVLDAADHVVLTQAPITVRLFGNPLPTVELAATDGGGLSPPGWEWVFQPQFPGAPSGQTFLLNQADGPVQYLSEVLTAGAVLPPPGGPQVYVQNNGLIVGNAALATNAVDGFLYIPSMPGTPTGTPTSQGAAVPLVIDSATGQLWAYIASGWKAITLS